MFSPLKLLNLFFLFIPYFYAWRACSIYHKQIDIHSSDIILKKHFSTTNLQEKFHCEGEKTLQSHNQNRIMALEIFLMLNFIRFFLYLINRSNQIQVTNVCRITCDFSRSLHVAWRWKNVTKVSSFNKSKLNIILCPMTFNIQNLV